MGKGVKARRQQSKNTNHHDNPNRVTKRTGVKRRHHSQSLTSSNKPKSESKRHLPSQKGSTTSHVQSNNKLANGKGLFTKHDVVLLVGEGDFSFAASLARNYLVRHIVATSFDTQTVLEEKYPHVERTIAQLEESTLKGKTVEKSVPAAEHAEEWNGFSSSSASESGNLSLEITDQETSRNTTQLTLLHGIDATKLASAHKKVLKQHSPFTKIVFNFPHVGGISTDVNRQVRSNQQLLVGFFNEAKSLLATPAHPATSMHSSRQEDTYATSEEEDEDIAEDTKSASSTKGYILVTLFEGEPYTLWNIRDLARHCGLKVVESFKFPWASFPGYKHARTIGEIKTGKDRTEEGKRKGAWRGEERDARCYMLTLKDAEGPYPAAGLGKRKRKSNGDDESE